VRFTWDPEKSERNLAERAFDFAFAASIFTGPTLERIDTRQDYGEVRRIALGEPMGSHSRWSTPIGLRLATSCDESFQPE
jgi:uncharacterized DUF497 family protein